MSNFRPRSDATPWVLSAKSAPALIEQAARLQRFVEQRADVDPIDVGYSLTAAPASFDHRAVVVGADRDDCCLGWRRSPPVYPPPMWSLEAFRYQVIRSSSFPAWVRSGLMAAELFETAPAFADQMRLCDGVFTEFVDWSLLDVVRSDAGAPSSTGPTSCSPCCLR